MKLTIKPTEERLTVNGVTMRLWTGVDENGTPVHALVHIVSPQTHDPERLAAFDAELKELRTRVAVTGVMMEQTLDGEAVDDDTKH